MECLLSRRYSKSNGLHECRIDSDLRSQAQRRGCLGEFKVAEVMQTPCLVQQHWGCQRNNCYQVSCLSLTFSLGRLLA